MVHNFSNDRINQLPMTLSGIFHAMAFYGISLSIFKHPVDLKNCEMPLLP
ncbi:RAxF-45 family protein [Paenibacillus sp.]|nr:RAxF-45 family protein [Paenibacillus sp.]